MTIIRDESGAPIRDEGEAEIELVDEAGHPKRRRGWLTAYKGKVRRR